MKCNRCSLAKNNRSVGILGAGKPQAKIMFIQDSPNEQDCERHTPFSGKCYTIISNLLKHRQIPIEDVYFTSLVRCFCEKDIPKDAYDGCKEFLEEEILMVDPDIIIPMGNKSLKFCINRVGITKMRGNAQVVQLLDRERIILPIIHPNLVDRKPLYKQYIMQDFDTLKGLYESGMTQISNVTYRYLETVEDVKTELDRMKHSINLVFDLETTGKSPYMDYSKIVCISLTDQTHYGVVIPLFKHDTPFSPNELKLVVTYLKDLMEDPKISKCAHNGKFDIEWLKQCLDIDVANFNFDTIFGHYLAISEEQGTQGLKSQAWEFTDMGGYDNELDEYVKKLSDGDGAASRYNYDRVPWGILRTYAAADVDCCLRLQEIYKPLIDQNPKWKILMKDILMPASYTLRDIQANGMLIDMERSEQLSKAYEAEINRITSRLESFPEVLELVQEKLRLYNAVEYIKRIPAKDRTPAEKEKLAQGIKFKDFIFNWSSVAQLRELLYDKLGLVSSIKTDKGLPSTNETALIELSEQHEIPKLMLELRKISTLNNMFIQKLPTMRDSNNIVHSSFNLVGTVTGRTSSENPK